MGGRAEGRISLQRGSSETLLTETLEGGSVSGRGGQRLVYSRGRRFCDALAARTIPVSFTLNWKGFEQERVRKRRDLWGRGKTFPKMKGVFFLEPEISRGREEGCSLQKTFRGELEMSVGGISSIPGSTWGSVVRRMGIRIGTRSSLEFRRRDLSRQIRKDISKPKNNPDSVKFSYNRNTNCEGANLRGRTGKNLNLKSKKRQEVREKEIL